MERRTDRNDRSDSTRTEAIVDARMHLALWLRAGRASRGLSLDDVARTTKIQTRILERLEAGLLDGLPAEVFVRGFVRSFARCVGLDEDEALRRYAACGSASGITPAARALVEAMADLVPGSAKTARATSPQMLAVDPAEVLAGGSLRDLPAELPSDRSSSTRATTRAGTDARDARFDAAPASSGSSASWLSSGAVVETMLLPETGTLVLASQPLPVIPVSIPPPAGVELAAPAPEATVEAAAAPISEVAREAQTASAVDAVAPSPAATDAAELADRADVRESTVVAAEPPQASEPVVDHGKRRGRRGKHRKRAQREMIAIGTPAGASPVVARREEAPAAAVGSELPTGEPSIAPAPAIVAAPAPSIVEQLAHDDGAPSMSGTWAPKMPPLATSSAPWRRPPHPMPAALVPSLVIDDADPESAERILEERAEEKHSGRRSFLPPILLDREDRSSRQGGLTLAVILLLIAATLTLSYLMRRPSASGDGMTLREAPALDVDAAAVG